MSVKDVSVTSVRHGQTPTVSEFSRSMGRVNSRRRRSSLRMSGMIIDSIFRNWADYSKVNFIENFLLSETSLAEVNLSSFTGYQGPSLRWPSNLVFMTEEDFMHEKFIVNVTPLLNENQLWGCFYNFPELYEDVYSPVVSIREVKDVNELVEGVLTRDMVSACYTYLKRTPILGDYVFIKLDLSFKGLVNIKVLQHYKFLVYLDLSSNYLTDISVLSYLLYLQFISVSYNRLTSVLEYDPPQWFLTEVHYKYNNVSHIRDISLFWSITVLDLSHNNITAITGLENLKFLRRLDLSFNHIRRIENLNHLVIIWLDLSYNNISSFEFSSDTGLWTLLHLEYLNLNENILTSMKLLSGCVRLREVHARNNRLRHLIEVAVYMRQLKQLTILDLRGNPVCGMPCYKDVIINTFPQLLSLDEEELDPVEQRSTKSRYFPDPFLAASRKLLRLLYIQQLGRARVSQYDPPADTRDVPLVVLVGYEAVGKGRLIRRLANEFEKHVEIAYQHTTAPWHFTNYYRQVTRDVFDQMLLNGEFLTYSEIEGESYGLSRQEACVKDGKVKIVALDLVAALMLKKRGLRPYLILANCFDKVALLERQIMRKEQRSTDRCSTDDISKDINIFDKSALQTLLSGRILIRGVLNEIIHGIPEMVSRVSEEFIDGTGAPRESELTGKYIQGSTTEYNRMRLIDSEFLSDSGMRTSEVMKPSQVQDTSLHSLFVLSHSITEDKSGAGAGQQSTYMGIRLSDGAPPRGSTGGQPGQAGRGIDFTRYASTTWQGGVSIPTTQDKVSKSVTFTSQDDMQPTQVKNPSIAVEDNNESKTGLLIEPPNEPRPSGSSFVEGDQYLKSLSTKVLQKHKRLQGDSLEDFELWLSFLDDVGLLRLSDINAVAPEEIQRISTLTTEDQNFIIKQLELYLKLPIYSSAMRWDYEEINRKHPGLFWDTINMDDPDRAFKKMKEIIKQLIDGQKNLLPMFNIDFTSDLYPPLQKRLQKICKEISPVTLFH